jgi:ferredoxin-NADP reductase
VHDTANLEAEGRPAVFIASTEFIQAAQAQADALGYDADRVFVPHPVQDRTDAEIRALAEAALAEILEHLTG